VYLHADVGDHHQLRHCVFYGADRLLHYSVGGEVLHANRVFLLGDAEQDTRSQPGDRLGLRRQAVHRPLEDAGGDDLSLARPGRTNRG
jgi:hypothetical protein